VRGIKLVSGESLPGPDRDVLVVTEDIIEVPFQQLHTTLNDMTEQSLYYKKRCGNTWMEFVCFISTGCFIFILFLFYLFNSFTLGSQGIFERGLSRTIQRKGMGHSIASSLFRWMDKELHQKEFFWSISPFNFKSRKSRKKSNRKYIFIGFNEHSSLGRCHDRNFWLHKTTPRRISVKFLAETFKQATKQNKIF